MVLTLLGQSLSRAVVGNLQGCLALEAKVVEPFWPGRGSAASRLSLPENDLNSFAGDGGARAFHALS
jgi:hypothetical protein